VQIDCRPDTQTTTKPSPSALKHKAGAPPKAVAVEQPLPLSRHLPADQRQRLGAEVAATVARLCRRRGHRVGDDDRLVDHRAGCHPRDVEGQGAGRVAGAVIEFHGEGWRVVLLGGWSGVVGREGNEGGSSVPGGGWLVVRWICGLDCGVVGQKDPRRGEVTRRARSRDQRRDSASLLSATPARLDGRFQQCNRGL